MTNPVFWILFLLCCSALLRGPDPRKKPPPEQGQRNFCHTLGRKHRFGELMMNSMPSLRMQKRVWIWGLAGASFGAGLLGLRLDGTNPLGSLWQWYWTSASALVPTGLLLRLFLPTVHPSSALPLRLLRALEYFVWLTAVIAVVFHPPFNTLLLQVLGIKTFTVLTFLLTPTWLFLTGRILFGSFFRSRARRSLRTGTSSDNFAGQPTLDIPTLTFSDLGDYAAAKRSIGELIESRLRPTGKSKTAVVRNGILAYGPTGTGKTTLLMAAAGTYRLRLFHIDLTTLVEKHLGDTEKNIRATVKAAAEEARKGPVLLLLDEFDAIGSARGNIANDSGGAVRAQNNAVIALMNCCKQYRSTPGLILAAATNRMETLESALIRDGVMDLKLRIDHPTTEDRREIWEKALLPKGWRGTPDELELLVHRTPDWTAARIEARSIAGLDRAEKAKQPFRTQHVLDAMRAGEQSDQSPFVPVHWDDVVLEPALEREVHSYITRLSNPYSKLSVRSLPNGLLLKGSPGTGKGTIARLMATESKRTFYPLSPASLIRQGLDATLTEITKVFQRAKENSPSILFIDEIDGVMNETLTNQLQIEMDGVQQAHQVFLMAATNRPEGIPDALRRGGRFSVKLLVDIPRPETKARYLTRLLADVPHAPTCTEIVEALPQSCAQGDLKAIVAEAIAHAAGRSDLDSVIASDTLPTLLLEDFLEASDRVKESATAFAF